MKPKKSAPKKPPAKPTARKSSKTPKTPLPKLTNYESEQLEEIKKWKTKEPSVADKAMGIVVQPFAWMVQKIVPEKAIMGALQMARKLSTMTVDTADVLREAGVSEVSDIRGKELKLSDRLADEVHNWGMGIAAAEGAGTGFFGIFGAPVDVPALITIALRTIEKIGVCYGYDCKTKEDEDFIMGILAASGANTVEEKLGALMALRTVESILMRQTWKKMAETAARNQLSKEGAIIGLRSLAKQLSINITKRKALAAIPFIGSLVGGSLNAWYLRDVGWAARRVFQERRLRESGKLKD